MSHYGCPLCGYAAIDGFEVHSALCTAVRQLQAEVARLRILHGGGYYYCAEHGHEQSVPCPECEKRKANRNGRP